MPKSHDGPQSPLLDPIPIEGNTVFSELVEPLVSYEMAETVDEAPMSACTAWGIPFEIDHKVVLIRDIPLTVNVEPRKAKWLTFLHTSDTNPLSQNEHGFFAAAGGSQFPSRSRAR